MREGLQACLSLPDLEAKQRLRAKNKELRKRLDEVRTQLTALQAAARRRLDEGAVA